ncbi:hypothetical protein EON68_01225, partial [archaeon]
MYFFFAGYCCFDADALWAVTAAVAASGSGSGDSSSSASSTSITDSLHPGPSSAESSVVAAPAAGLVDSIITARSAASEPHATAGSLSVRTHAAAAAALGGGAFPSAARDADTERSTSQSVPTSTTVDTVQTEPVSVVDDDEA